MFSALHDCCVDSALCWMSGGVGSVKGGGGGGGGYNVICAALDQDEQGNAEEALELYLQGAALLREELQALAPTASQQLRQKYSRNLAQVEQRISELQLQRTRENIPPQEGNKREGPP